MLWPVSEQLLSFLSLHEAQEQELSSYFFRELSKWACLSKVGEGGPVARSNSPKTGVASSLLMVQGELYRVEARVWAIFLDFPASFPLLSNCCAILERSHCEPSFHLTVPVGSLLIVSSYLRHSLSWLTGPNPIWLCFATWDGFQIFISGGT